MHLFIEKRMRDGISYIAKRHSKIADCDIIKKRNPSCIGMQTIYMTRVLINQYHMVDLIG